MDKAARRTGYVDKIADMLSGALFQNMTERTKATRQIQILPQSHCCSMIGLEALEPLPVLLLSCSGALDQAGEWLQDCDFMVQFAQSFENEISILRTKKVCWSIVIVAIDDFGGMANVEADFRQLRQRVPDLPIVFLSDAMDHDDFSKTMKYPCDAVVRLPITLPRLNIAICEAISNSLQRESEFLAPPLPHFSQSGMDAFAQA